MSGDISNSELYLKLADLIKQTNEDTKEEIKNEIQELNERLRNKIQEQESKYRELENQHIELKKNYERLDRQSRKNSLVIFGLETKDKRDNLPDYVTNTLGNLLDIQIDVGDLKDIHVVAAKSTTFIKAEFMSAIKVKTILTNTQKLRNSGITISRDLTPQERKDRSVLLSHLREARSKKNYAKIVGNRLLVNGDFYTINQLQETEYIDFSRKSNSAPATPNAPRNRGTLDGEEAISQQSETEKVEVVSATYREPPSTDVAIPPKPTDRQTTTTRQRLASQSSASSTSSATYSNITNSNRPARNTRKTQGK